MCCSSGRICAHYCPLVVTFAVGTVLCRLDTFQTNIAYFSAIFILEQESIRARAWRPSLSELTTDPVDDATAKFLRQLSDNHRAPWPAILKLGTDSRTLEVCHLLRRSGYHLARRWSVLLFFEGFVVERAAVTHVEALLVTYMTFVTLTYDSLEGNIAPCVGTKRVASSTSSKQCLSLLSFTLTCISRRSRSSRSGAWVLETIWLPRWRR